MRVIRLTVALTALNFAILLASLVQTGEAGAQATVDVLRGRSLELVDQRGQVRARLNLEADGQVVFRLMDQRGTIRVKLGADEEGSGLLLANDATEPGLHLLANSKGTRIRLAHKDGRERIITP